MNTADPTTTSAFDRSVPSPGRRSVLRTVAVPTEHGGWSLTLEPVLLALLVAWSWSGLALGVAAMLAFVARTPVRVVLVDGWRRRWLDRTRIAALVATAELIGLVVLVTIAGSTGEGRFWIPFAVAAPLIAVELWVDMRSRSRRLIPELAGTIGIGSVAAAITLPTVRISVWHSVCGAWSRLEAQRRFRTFAPRCSGFTPVPIIAGRATSRRSLPLPR